MDVITATREIKKLGVETPIIAWSTHSEYKIGKSCREAGMVDYIEMDGYPYLMPRIMTTLRNYGVPMSDKY